MPEETYFQVGKVAVGSSVLLGILGAAAGVTLVLVLSRLYWNGRLKKWAEEEGLQLVGFRGAWFYEGPSAWTRSRSQHLFLVTTRDKNEIQRSCWIMFGTWWGFTWGEPITKVQWTDDNN